MKPEDDPDDKWDSHWISGKIEQRTLEQVIEAHVRKVCSQCRGNVTVAAKVLGVTRTTVQNYAVRFNLKFDRRKPPPWRLPDPAPPEAAAKFLGAKMKRKS